MRYYNVGFSIDITPALAVPSQGAGPRQIPGRIEWSVENWGNLAEEEKVVASCVEGIVKTTTGTYSTIADKLLEKLAEAWPTREITVVLGPYKVTWSGLRELIIGNI